MSSQGPFQSLWDVFEATAERAGDRVAIEDDGQELTFSGLRAQAESLAGALVSKVGRQKQNIGVRARSCSKLTAALLAVQRAGMVSVCLDIRDPEERLRAVCADAEVRTVITDCDGTPGDVGELRLGAAELTGAELGWRPQVGPDDISCITYSSGSTGMPKGIIWDQKARVAMTARTESRFPKRGRLAGPFVGSASNSDGQLSITALGTTIIPYPLLTLGLSPLPGWAREHGVTSLGLVPSLVRHLLASMRPDDILAVENVVMYGEGSLWQDIVALRRHLPEAAVIHSTYGSMEMAGLGTYFRIDSSTPVGQGRVPAGWAQGGEPHVVIVDSSGAPVPTGEIGEIVVEGTRMGTGYWRKPELTSQKWQPLSTGGTRYWSGDLGRLDDTGCLEIIGRNDHMVKVNGFKVELQAIERALLAVPGVATAAAVARQDTDGNVRAVAWATATGGHNERSLRAELCRCLPGSMVPDRVVLVDKLPHLSNGKIDRQDLTRRPLPEPPSRPGGDKLTDEICALFDRVLNGHGTQPDDDFFEMGGDSLRAARLIVEIQKVTGVFLGVAVMLECRTPAALAAMVSPRLASSSSEPPSRLVPIRVSGDRPPLVVVHDGTAGVMYAGAIAQLLGPDFPVYAIEGQQTGGLPAVDRTIPEMAARYVGYITRALPEGPCCLFGGSLGGVLAYEIACQLHAKGREVPLLTMADAPAPMSTANSPTSVPSTRATMAAITERARELGMKGTAAASITRARWTAYNLRSDRRLKAAQRQLSQGLPIPLDLRERFAMWDHREVGRTYKPGPYSGRTLLFLASKNPFADGEGWRQLAPDLTVVDAGAEHHEMMKPGFIEPIVKQMGEVLDQACAGVAPSAPGSPVLAGTNRPT